MFIKGKILYALAVFQSTWILPLEWDTAFLEFILDPSYKSWMFILSLLYCRILFIWSVFEWTVCDDSVKLRTCSTGFHSLSLPHHWFLISTMCTVKTSPAGHSNPLPASQTLSLVGNDITGSELGPDAKNTPKTVQEQTGTDTFWHQRQVTAQLLMLQNWWCRQTTRLLSDLRNSIGKQWDRPQDTAVITRGRMQLRLYLLCFSPTLWWVVSTSRLHGEIDKVSTCLYPCFG